MAYTYTHGTTIIFKKINITHHSPNFPHTLFLNFSCLIANTVKRQREARGRLLGACWLLALIMEYWVVLVIVTCYYRLPLNWQLKTTKFIISQFFWVRNLGLAFGSGSLERLKSRGWQRLQTFHWGRIYFQAHSCESQVSVLAGCSFLPLKPRVGTTWRLTSLRASERESPGQKPLSLCNLILEVASPHFSHILFIKSESQSPAHTQKEGSTQGLNI